MELELQQSQLPATAESSPSDLLHQAVSRGADVETIKALVDLRNSMEDRAAKAEFNRSMIAAQAAMPRVTRGDQVINHKTGAVQSRYATLERIDKIVRDIIQQFGFSFSCAIESLEAGKYIVAATVRHSAGHVEVYRMPLALDQSGAKNDTQGMGSTLSYGRRYLLCSIFNIITEGEDTDGYPRTPEPLITQHQADDLKTMIEAGGWNLEKTKVRIGGIVGAPIAMLNEIPAKHYQQIVAALQSKVSK